ncbi:hypothetical protein XU18_2655 [Perkinsela sp. CCAP 1560/4]|nr:hypothetical protein XU18_4670 [Perkinsela sp. CCAP 1560/4]KNH06451.1 hypothetical protein XU18_2655 [Perkinsela sp. CCAP 1560/4]|eukprot:KNH04000.1 hypothetical protein XU18_4670 [Perkinsela sp. CCAP 1560/4]
MVKLPPTKQQRKKNKFAILVIKRGIDPHRSITSNWEASFYHQLQQISRDFAFTHNLMQRKHDAWVVSRHRSPLDARHLPAKCLPMSHRFPHVVFSDAFAIVVEDVFSIDPDAGGAVPSAQRHIVCHCEWHSHPFAPISVQTADDSSKINT